MQIIENQTRYATEDLQALADAVEKSVAVRNGIHHDVIVFNIGKPRRPYRWRDEVEYVTWDYGYAPSGVRATRIGIITPRNMPRSAVEAVCDPVPTKLVPEVVQALAKALGKSQASQLDEDKVATKFRSFEVRIRKNRHVPPRKRRKITDVDRIATYSKRYGPGGVLNGPQRYVRNTVRANTDMWEYRVKFARERYERELSYRNRQRDRLTSLGVEVPPYETFPEYLRRMADAFEEGG